MRKLTSVEEFSQLKNKGKHIFLFTAKWCPDCRVIEPFLDELEEKFPSFTFISVDRDEFIDLARELQIFGIPSFLAFADGVELDRFVSKDRKTQAEIEQFIKNLL